MQALNQKERKNKILKFSLYFTSLFILLIILFFNLCHFRNELNDRQKLMLMRYNRFLKAEKVFVKKTVELDSLIMQLKPSITLELDAQDIGKKINFSDALNRDTSFKALTLNLEDVFKNYLKLKVKFLKETNDGQKINNQINELKAELKEKELELNNLKLILYSKGVSPDG